MASNYIRIPSPELNAFTCPPSGFHCKFGWIFPSEDEKFCRVVPGNKPEYLLANECVLRLFQNARESLRLEHLRNSQNMRGGSRAVRIVRPPLPLP